MNGFTVVDEQAVWCRQQAGPQLDLTGWSLGRCSVVAGLALAADVAAECLLGWQWWLGWLGWQWMLGWQWWLAWLGWQLIAGWAGVAADVAISDS